jgi:hypothetical protein
MQAIGQAVYVRTDSPDYIEVVRPFRTLQDLFDVCVNQPSNLSLERILVFSSRDGEPGSVTLASITTALGIRPDFSFLKIK